MRTLTNPDPIPQSTHSSHDIHSEIQKKLSKENAEWEQKFTCITYVFQTGLQTIFLGSLYGRGINVERSTLQRAAVSPPPFSWATTVNPPQKIRIANPRSETLSLKSSIGRRNERQSHRNRMWKGIELLLWRLVSQGTIVASISRLVAVGWWLEVAGHYLSRQILPTNEKQPPPNWSNLM